MVFSSSIFLLYFLPLFLVLYFLVPQKLKNWVALIASLFFYGFGAPKFIFVLLLSIAVDFFIVKKIDSSKENKTRTLLLLASILLNLGLLAYFKYANFMVHNVNALLFKLGFSTIEWTKVLLPIGISFFTFHKLSYSIDVYRRKNKSLHSIRDYALYILLFPQLIAGPIIRYNVIAGDLVDRKQNENIDNKILGLYRFIIGLAKKVLIANTLGQVVDTIFAVPAAQTESLTLWIGIIAYSFQIYYDFSGYSDMAIGIARMIGFKFPENFNNPYVSQNISEFWRRWHMTLGAWLKDYLFFPVATIFSKRLIKRRYFFLKAEHWIYAFASVITMLLCGLWHGSAWNFVVWGAFNAFFMILDRLFLIKLLRKIGKLPRIILTYFIVLIGWVIFRAEGLKVASIYFKKMFSFNFNQLPDYMDNKFWSFLIIGFIFSFIGVFKFGAKLENFFFYKEYNAIQYVFVGLILVVLFVLSLSFITKGGFNPFIYFRF